MSKPEIAKPTIHLNGTSHNYLKETARDALRAVTIALRAVEQAAPNARDYYPQGGDAIRVATGEHVARLVKLQSVQAELGELVEHIESHDRTCRSALY